MSSEHEMDETPLEDVTEDSAAHEDSGEAHAADADFTDEDWNDEGDASEGDQTGEGGDGVAPKKKKMKMNMMIIGAFAVIGLGIVYWQMSNKSVPLPPPTAMQAVPAPPPTDTDMVYGASESQQPKTDKNKQATKGILDDPNAIKKIQKLSDSHVVTAEEIAPETPTPSLVPKEVKSAPPMPAPISQAEHKPMPGPVSSGPLTPLPQEAAGTPFAKTAAPTTTAAQSAAVKTTPALTEPAKTVTTTPEKGANAPWPSPSTEKTASPAWPAPTPEKPVKSAGSEAVPAKIPDASKPALATPTATAPVIAATNATDGSLDRIAGKLDGIESQLKALQESSVRKDELADIKAQLNSLQDKVNNISAQPDRPMSKSTKEKIIHRQHASTHATKSVRQKAAPVISSWTLKSAQPGMAIVAQGGGQMVTIRPGDTLRGLGRIKSIGEEKGRWVVKGTSGILTQ